MHLSPLFLYHEILSEDQSDSSLIFLQISSHLTESSVAKKPKAETCKRVLASISKYKEIQRTLEFDRHNLYTYEFVWNAWRLGGRWACRICICHIYWYCYTRRASCVYAAPFCILKSNVCYCFNLDKDTRSDQRLHILHNNVLYNYFLMLAINNIFNLI